MLTRCPSCATHFRVTPEQLKARAGRVRCGACQNVFNALDSLIEEPIVVPVPAAGERDAAPTFPGAVPPALTIEEPAASTAAVAANAKTEDRAFEPAGESSGETGNWIITYADPPPRRWPWVVGSLIALAALGLQALVAFRVELSVLWPEARPKLIALCDLAGCEVGFPAKIALVGIEASDLHPDSGNKGRLALSATLKNRAPFVQQFPHLELTLTDTADKAIARKVLVPRDYLPLRISDTDGMPPSAEIPIVVGVDSGDMAASGYRLYLFYP